MVSDSSMADKEGWPLVDALGTESCTPSSVDHRRASLPPVVHYCQVRPRERKRQADTLNSSKVFSGSGE